MKKYIVRTGVGEAFNAASKARRDADAIAVSLGFNPLVFEGERTGNGAILNMIRLGLNGVENWRRLIRETEPGSCILIQYPHYPLKSAFLMKHMMRKAQRTKNLQFTALVHDLDSLRGLHGKAAVYSDNKVLPLFDRIICHNDRMKAYLVQKGISAEKLVVLELFDYLTDTSQPIHSPEDGIAIAGNLDPEKSGYISEWIKECKEKTPAHLYGKGLENTTLPEQAFLHGMVPPEKLPGVIAGGYGLVWDGNSADTCNGDTGKYLRYNNPHKLSLYLASGMPVIIWKEAAAAECVKKQGVGLLIDHLSEIGDLIIGISGEEYQQMADQAAEIGQKLREGYYLSSALGKAMQGAKS